MKNGCPTVKCIILLLLLASALGFNFIPQRAAGVRGKPYPKSPFAHKVSRDVVDKARAVAPTAQIPVIVQLNDKANSSFESEVARKSGQLKATLREFNTRVIDLPAKAVDDLAARTDVDFISLDRQNISFGHVTTTTGAEAARLTTASNSTGLDGTGIGIAVLDSGIDANHTSFLDRRGRSRVIVSLDFTGEGRVDDPFGHGTHLASIAAGNGRIANAQFTGIASNASLINLRVLNSSGSGRVSSVLAALDWVLANRNTYNIRVVNMSLGAPAVDSYAYDPVCRAVRKLVDAGIVVVAAVGNNGVNSGGTKVYGQVHSPGIEPSAITVGASNSFGTDERNDDGVATYSSRGPTRSSYLDSSGVRHYDHLIKPDVVAPGNKIIEAASRNNYLLTHNPWLDAGVSKVEGRRMMYLNGSSVATPVVTG